MIYGGSTMEASVMEASVRHEKEEFQVVFQGSSPVYVYIIIYMYTYIIYEICGRLYTLYRITSHLPRNCRISWFTSFRTSVSLF